MHACEGDAVTKLTNEKIPFFNAPIYLQNMTQIGKVDEIFGPINESVRFFLSLLVDFSSSFIVCFVEFGCDVIFLLVFFVLQYFSIKMMEGIVATSYSAGDKFYIDPRKLLPLARFLPQPKYVLIASHYFCLCF